MGRAVGLNLGAVDIADQGVVSLNAYEAFVLNTLKCNDILCVAHDGAAKASVLVNRRAGNRRQAKELAIGGCG